MLKLTGTMRKLEVTYDTERKLRKVIIEADENTVKRFLDRLDAFFGTEKLKPSSHISIEHWKYGLDTNGKKAYLYMGSDKLKVPSAVRKRFMAIVSKQRYLFARGAKFIARREEKIERGIPKPKSGHLDIGVDGGIAQMFIRALSKYFSYSLPLVHQRERVTVFVLLGNVPQQLSIIDSIVSYLYEVDERGLTIRLSPTIRSVLIPHNVAHLLVETPDIAYYNLLFKVLHDYSKGTVDVRNWPPIRIYVYPGESLSEEKTILSYLDITYHEYINISEALKAMEQRYGVSVSKIANVVNMSIGKLCEIIAEAAGRRLEEILLAMEVIMPSFRIFLNDLVCGKLNREALYSITRMLAGYERVDKRFSEVARILLAML